jgi:hypothetical protein
VEKERNMTQPNDYLSQIPAVDARFTGADVTDIKTIDATLTVRQFVAGLLSYQPGWVQFMFRVRRASMELMHIAQAEAKPPALTPENLPVTPGEEAFIFTVVEAQEDRFWIGTMHDDHLDADFMAVAEPLKDGRNRIYAITLVRFNKPIGRLYFRFIEPFHHLIMRTLMNSAVRRTQPPRLTPA